MKPEQRATSDETHALKMPRQGVSFLNDMLDDAIDFTIYRYFPLPNIF